MFNARPKSVTASVSRFWNEDQLMANSFFDFDLLEANMLHPVSSGAHRKLGWHLNLRSTARSEAPANNDGYKTMQLPPRKPHPEANLV